MAANSVGQATSPPAALQIASEFLLHCKWVFVYTWTQPYMNLLGACIAISPLCWRGDWIYLKAVTCICEAHCGDSHITHVFLHIGTIRDKW